MKAESVVMVSADNVVPGREDTTAEQISFNLNWRCPPNPVIAYGFL
jgi:hypothetical protein